MVRAVLVLIVLAARVGPARADMYSFTDEEGTIHFTNLKPHGGKWRKVMDSPAPSGSKAAAQRGSCPRCDKIAEGFAHGCDEPLQAVATAC